VRILFDQGTPVPLRDSLMQHGVFTSAHCLEYDFATQAKTLEDLATSPLVWRTG
jgi:hypothetical protein